MCLHDCLRSLSAHDLRKKPNRVPHTVIEGCFYVSTACSSAINECTRLRRDVLGIHFLGAAHGEKHVFMFVCMCVLHDRLRSMSATAQEGRPRDTLLGCRTREKHVLQSETSLYTKHRVRFE